MLFNGKQYTVPKSFDALWWYVTVRRTGTVIVSDEFFEL
jgi:hypothetical protein